MKRLTITWALIISGLAGCVRAGNIEEGGAAGNSSPEMLLILLAAAVLYLSFSGLAARLLRRKSRSEVSFDSFHLESRLVWARATRTHRRRRRRRPGSEDPSTSASDSVSSLPEQYRESDGSS